MRQMLKKGVNDALKKGYLSKVVFTIIDSKTDQVIELYEFEILYSEDGDCKLKLKRKSIEKMAPGSTTWQMSSSNTSYFPFICKF